MHIAFGEHFIEISRWESRTQMIRYLREGCAAGSILLGEDAEMATEFYTATLYLGARASRFGIGICSEGHGLTPQMLLLAEEGTLMFGFNREVVALSIMDMEIEPKFRMELPALFHRFVFLKRMSLILIFYEIGVVALSQTGHCLWQYERDLITDYLVTSDRLIVEFMDSPAVAIDLLTGTVSSVSP